MSDGLYAKAFNFMIRNEGGFVDDPVDHGGATKYGISMSFLLQAYQQGSLWADINGDGKIDRSDIVGINLDIARIIYKQQFWNKVKNIPDDDLAVKLFDTAVHIGPKKAISLLQKILKVTPDGIIGRQTINAIHNCKSTTLLMKSYIERLSQYYASLVCQNSKYLKYIQGWLKRAERLPNLKHAFPEKPNVVRSRCFF